MANIFQHARYHRAGLLCRTRFCIRTSCILFFLLSSVVFANVQVNLPKGNIELGTSFKAQFIVTNAPQQLASPNFSGLNKDFSIISSEQSYSMQVINGKRQSRTVFELELRPKRNGKLTVPAMQFGTFQSKPKTITVRPPQKKPGKAKDFYIEVTAKPENPYVQQEVKFTFRVFMGKQLSGNISPPQLKGNGIIQPLGDARDYRQQKSGKNYQVHERIYMIYPQESGQVDILPLKLTGNYIANRKRYRVNKQSRRIRLNVRPAPSAFTGSYWLPAKKIQLSDSWSGDLSEWKKGEAQTRTIRLRGEGLLANQLPELTLPEIDYFNTYANRQTGTKNTARQRNGFTGVRTQEIVMIPTKVGSYSIEEVKIPWWNTVTDRMEYATLPSVAVQIQDVALGTLVMEDTLERFQSDFDPASAGNYGMSIWHWLSVIFGLGWLLTVSFIAWKNYSKRNLQSSLLRRYQKSMHQCRKQVKIACLKNDAETTRAALLKWSRAVWSDDPPGALGQIAVRCSADLKAEMQILEKFLYAKNNDDVWEGTLLWDIFSHEAITFEDKLELDEGQLEVFHKLS